MIEKTHRRTEYTAFSKRPSSWMTIFVLVLVTFVAYSQTVSANWQSGLFSFMAGIVSTGKVSADINIPTDSSTSTGYSGNFLQAPSNPHPEDVSQVPPIDDNTLVPEIASANGTSSLPVNTDIGIYTVRPGDTISSISKMFDISQDTIKQSNKLTSSTLKLGQTLTILPRSGLIYVVQKGDTLGSIAKKYKADVNDILDYNDIASSSLAVGIANMFPDAQPLPSDFAQAPIVSHGSKVPSFEPLLDNVSAWPSYPGYFARPIDGGRISQGLHGHNAIDFAAPQGTPIHASADGVVIIAKMNNAWNGGYGNYIVISHSNGTQTLYAHMQIKSKGLVSVGDQVEQGETIGYIGMTGLTTGPHVHFEIRGAKNPF